MPEDDELVDTIARALRGASYEEAQAAGRALAAESQMPSLVAENLGAGFGQWEFFPEAAEIVAFARGYVAPATEDDVWALARAWASDDAAGRQTVLALVGRDLLNHELRRIEVPALRALVDEARPAKALAIRASLGLEVPPAAAASSRAARTPRPKPTTEAPPPPPVEVEPAEAAAPSTETAPAASASPTTAMAPAAAPARAPQVAPAERRMPKPAFVRPVPAAAPLPPKRVSHPKFGEGTLESQDGAGPDAKLTIKFASGTKTLLARYVTELG